MTEPQRDSGFKSKNSEAAAAWALRRKEQMSRYVAPLMHEQGMQAVWAAYRRFKKAAWGMDTLAVPVQAIHLQLTSRQQALGCRHASNTTDFKSPGLQGGRNAGRA